MMSRSMRGGQSPWILLLLLLAGGLAGSALAGTVAKTVPFLATSSNIGMRPATLDLQFLKITFGFTLNLGPMTALGMLLGYLIFRKV